MSHHIQGCGNVGSQAGSYTR